MRFVNETTYFTAINWMNFLENYEIKVFLIVRILKIIHIMIQL
ncbi:hypothetical protein Bccel_0786 [Pseudobacteroides cellulosolvens ATCC 35603 = DSM 2933]|uniref:Uncharacterized protein n=1 Tax=Pseudobacteroides cellulosolvens ATCC 35603 = DSM 2933 TaxID=398512 RepID=A0A0L6JI47_9FIRM|nr:hypothetical protein Bccel_0786 [Pseudobacteroides cellulosolvens ATCC 35603 = DSM 2933]